MMIIWQVKFTVVRCKVKSHDAYYYDTKVLYFEWFWGDDDDDDEVEVDNYWGCSIFDNLSLYYTIYKCCS